MPHCPAHLRWFALFLLLLSAALPSTTSTSSSTTAPAPSDAASPARPPSRSTTPALPRLHILSSLQLASFSHAVAPFEICKRLAARGHRITWVDMVVHEHWYTADERREAGFHRWLKAGDDVYTNWSAAWEQWSGKHVEGGMAGLNDFSRYLMEPLYVPSMHTLQRLIDEDRPDAMICDAFAHSCVDIAEHLGIPFVFTWPGGLGGFGLGEAFDSPSLMTGYSHEWHQQPLWHRLWNTFGVLPYTIYLLGAIEPRFNQLRAQYGIRPNVAPSDKWLGHDIILNSHVAWDYATYLPPYIHLLGPITRTTSRDVKAASNIATPLRSWLDESEQRGIPVLYLALGSLAFLDEREQAVFLRAFASCPAQPPTTVDSSSNQHSPASAFSSDVPQFRVVWQSNKPLAASTRAAMPEWVREEKWVAQPAVLAHPATTLFISHAGSQSVQEAIAVGLPLLAVPFFGDQHHNAARLKDKNVSLMLEHSQVSDDELCHAIRHLVYSPTVRAAVDRLQLVSHLAVDGARRGADVVERAAYVGTAHLLPYRERKDVSWLVRYNVDVYAVGACMLLLATYAVYRAAATAAGAAVSALGGGSGSKSKLA